MYEWGNRRVFHFPPFPFQWYLFPGSKLINAPKRTKASPKLTDKTLPLLPIVRLRAELIVQLDRVN